MTFISYAQNFEDVMLWRALKNVANGFYIDVGAGHPDDYSVTRAFYDRGWHGINIEPSNRFARLAGARARDVNIHAAVGSNTGQSTLYVVENNEDISTLDPAIAEMHSAAGWAVTELEIPIVTLAEVCRRHVRSEVNFLKVDVEGAERDVLLGADPGHFRPWIVVVEATAPNSQAATHTSWEQILTAVEYRFVWFDGLNRFYIAGEHWENLSAAFATPPNIFDDFIRATDTEHVNRIAAAEAWAARSVSQAAEAEVRAAEAQVRAAEAQARVAEAEACAAEAEIRAAEAEARAAEAEARAAEAGVRADEAAARTAQTEARTAQAEAHAQDADARGRSAEERLSDLDIKHNATLAEITGLRASTSWRLTAPLRALSGRVRRRKAGN